ncbi:unnamed protein product [Penicillium roqueforti FM164]|uniref:Genomic scaffold, ProqFM164S01 n=1 Tax=Penicillium roqueforti (strain FM164) TaxID=1365484 RepID=W6Q296_PENRF|nr:unnamed protein product [Penicillium roqueforti FM164]
MFIQDILYKGSRLVKVRFAGYPGRDIPPVPPPLRSTHLCAYPI